MQCLTGLLGLTQLQLVSLDYPSSAGCHDLTKHLAPLTQLPRLKNLMVQELQCPLPANLPLGCELSLDLSLQVRRWSLSRADH